MALQSAWPVPLLGPYFERRFQELVPGSAISAAAVKNAGADRQARSNEAIQQALGTAICINRRPDGKPEVRGNAKIEVSVSHTVNLTLAVARPGPIACDIELVEACSPSAWQALLGLERFALAELISKESGEDLDTAATRIWAATECLKKAGLVFDTPLVFLSSTADRWILLSSGPFIIAVLLAPLQGIEGRVVIGGLT
jgi:enediyne polyketide synthase